MTANTGCITISAIIKPRCSVLPAAVCILAAVGGCSQPTPGTIQDLRVFPQDCAAYLNADTRQQPLVAPAEQLELAARFQTAHFAPWHRSSPLTTRAQAVQESDRCVGQPGYSDNAQLYTAKWAAEIGSLAQLEHFPNSVARGITVRNTDLRALPTHRPRFKQFDLIDGFPFDMLQESAVCAGTPVFICHTTIDGEWCYVEAPFAKGWIPAQDLAPIDTDTVQRYESAPLVAIVNDDLPVNGKDGAFLFKAHIGALFPLAGPAPKPTAAGASSPPAQTAPAMLSILVPLRGQDGKAQLQAIGVKAGDAAVMPLPLTPEQIARIANRMLGQPYGWGGQYEHRDCSATIRDLFAPFGVWLPRNSADQIKSGQYVSLREYSPAEREQRILKTGVPFGTLLRAPGHIMLYIGPCNDHAIIYHNFWGVPVKPFLGTEGRHVIGRCVITSLGLGSELPDLYTPGGDPRNRIEGMTYLFGPAPSVAPRKK